MGIAVLVNVVLNIILIPQYTYVGAAVASLASTVVLFLLGMHFVPKIVDYSRWYLVKGFSKILVASLVMAGVIYYLLPQMYFLWLVPIGAIVYFLVLWILRGINKQDVVDVWNSVIRG